MGGWWVVGGGGGGRRGWGGGGEGWRGEGCAQRACLFMQANARAVNLSQCAGPSAELTSRKNPTPVPSEGMFQASPAA